MKDPAFTPGKPAPYFCPACQAVPREGYCKMAGCPTAPAAIGDVADAHKWGRFYIAKAESQRDALLAALKAILASEDGFYRVAMPSSLREAACAAVAKVEGGQ